VKEQFVAADKVDHELARSAAVAELALASRGWNERAIRALVAIAKLDADIPKQEPPMDAGLAYEMSWADHAHPGDQDRT